MAHDCDVLVIGGGPAGSTAAALLAERGCDVVLLEQAEHPRFHIGESLLPANMPLLARLGVAEQVAAAGTFKPGAEFVDDDTGHRSAFSFNVPMNGANISAYQVPRAPFDEILFRNAAARGRTDGRAHPRDRRDAGAPRAERARVTAERGRRGGGVRAPLHPRCHRARHADGGQSWG